jgi:NADH-quinone oxidoreductase subunit C
MTLNPEMLQAAIRASLGDRVLGLQECLGEVTLDVGVDDYSEVARFLRDDGALRFEQLIDLCGVDYSTYGGRLSWSTRFAVTSHLLSIAHNCRLRLRVFCADDDFPEVPSLVGIWSSADWFEREAFDLFGIVFEGHPDLRRLLTDYGFVGHPFRKDFPLSGYVEMRYDAEQKRVIYQPVTIESREIVPRVVRGDSYGTTGRK